MVRNRGWFVHSAERRRRLSPLRGVPVLHVGKIALLTSNLASPPLRRGAADYRRYAEFLSCTWASGTDGRQSRFVPSTGRRRRRSPLRGVRLLHIRTWHSWQAIWLRPLYGEAPQICAVARSSCPAYAQMAPMASNLASPPLRRGTADVRRYAEFLSCVCANCINGKQAGVVPSTERRRRLPPLRGVPVLNIGKLH